MQQLKRLTGLATRVFNTPLAIWPSKGDAILHVLAPRLSVEAPNVPLALLDVEKENREALAMTSDGIAVIDICGTLVRKASGLDALSGLASYADIEADFQAAMDNPRCKGILALFDTPGGEVGGLFDLCDKLRAFGKQKKVYGSVSEMACSAGYAIAAAVCEKIFITQTAAVGSIGVYCMHVDQSGYDEKIGVKYGARKAEGNTHEPLSTSAREDYQSEIDRTGDKFVGLVAETRGMTTKSVKATEAGVFFAENAVQLRLADAIGTQEDALMALRKALGVPTVLGSVAQANEGENHVHVNVNVLDAADLIAGSPSAVSLSKHVARAVSAAMNPQSQPQAATIVIDPEDDEECDPDDESCANDNEEMNQDETTSPTPKQKKEKAAMNPQDAATAQAAATQLPAIDAEGINALCLIAGRTDLLSGFIQKKMTVADVQAELIKLASEESSRHNVSSHVANAMAKAGGVTGISQMLGEARNAAATSGITKEKAFVNMLRANPNVYAQYKAQKQAIAFRFQAGDPSAAQELLALQAL